MHFRLMRPATLLPFIVLLATSAACSATRVEDPPPAWSKDPSSGLDDRVVLTGVGSAHGDDADAAEAARRAAMAAISEQLVTRVEARTDSHQRESSIEHMEAGRSNAHVFASDLRERIIRVTSEGELLGTRFELARTVGASGPLTWARAVVDRAEMAETTLATVSEDIRRARTAVDSARRALAVGNAPTERLANGIRHVLAADQALSAPRAVLPLLTAIRPAASRRATSETALIATLDRDVGALLAQIATRLDVQLVGEASIGFGGQTLPVGLSARWDGAPLPGLVLAARFGSGSAASGRTAADGRVTISVPAPRPALPSDEGLLAGPDLAGGLGVIRFALPVRYPRPADSRVAVTSRHERLDAGDRAPRVQVPSPLQPELEELLGAMHFPVVAAAVPPGANVLSPEVVARSAGSADYVLQVATRTVYSSSDGPLGPLWYRSAVELRLTQVATGETLTVSIAERDTKAAGATPDQAADRSLAAALRALARSDEPSSLVGMLHARFR